MDFKDLEKLINDVGNNPDVLKLVGEIEAIVEGKDSKTKLLAFLPMVAKILYDILDKDGSHENTFEMVEALIKIILSQVEKNKLAAR